MNPGNKAAEEKFKQLSSAFEVLGDSKKRKLYDEFGEDAAKIGFDEKKAEAYRAYKSQGPSFRGGGEGVDFSEIFGDLFGRARGGRQAGGGFGFGFPQEDGPQGGQDLSSRVQVSLSEAVTGTERTLELARPGRCGTCDGTGHKGRPAVCKTCKGTGRARMGQGQVAFMGVCPTCEGTGEVAPACPTCEGSGVVSERKRLSVKIPAGVATGSRVRLGGQGAAGTHGGPAGDLFLDVEVLPHPLVKRDGDDLEFDLHQRRRSAEDGYSDGAGGEIGRSSGASLCRSSVTPDWICAQQRRQWDLPGAVERDVSRPR